MMMMMLVLSAVFGDVRDRRAEAGGQLPGGRPGGLAASRPARPGRLQRCRPARVGADLQLGRLHVVLPLGDVRLVAGTCTLLTIHSVIPDVLFYSLHARGPGADATVSK